MSEAVYRNMCLAPCQKTCHGHLAPMRMPPHESVSMRMHITDRVSVRVAAICQKCSDPLHGKDADNSG